ncbi:glycosyltransferase family 2 protein [Aliterella atlantica]|uniref:Glycosyl transferase family A n=1 Tax=Aliterella atlantica CENA595 TaxID=1618023 RepID=A0A0D8ZRI1_9CYAN|nr:glycosyltransferase family 2 protein [Aliterella atlantica]KJH71119.1 glycosyl transferase family A [Aliterella atlantica CENA595]
MPKVSVIIPAYNAEKTIRETIETVRQQTFPDWEIIIINDGSKDKTLEIVASIEDERIKVFSYENSGLSMARNRGISKANGEYIALLDADDLWTPDKLELQLLAFNNNPQAGVAYSWTYFMDVDEQGKVTSLHPSNPYAFAGNVYENLLISDFIHSGSNTLILKQAIDTVGEFDPTLKSCEDWDYWLRLATRWHFVVVPKHQIYYRRSPNSMSSKVEIMKAAALMSIDKAYQAAPPNLQHLKSLTMTNFHKYCASLYLQHRPDFDGINQAQQHLRSAISIQPQTLLDKVTQKLILKLLLQRVFPKQVSQYLMQKIRQPAASNSGLKL